MGFIALTPVKFGFAQAPARTALNISASAPEWRWFWNQPNPGQSFVVLLNGHRDEDFFHPGISPTALFTAPRSEESALGPCIGIGNGSDTTTRNAWKYTLGGYSGTGTNFTYLCLINSYALSDAFNIWFQSSNTTGQGVRWSHNASGGITFTKGGVVDLTFSPALTMRAGTWHAFAQTYNHTSGLSTGILRDLQGGNLDIGTSTNTQAWAAGTGDYIIGCNGAANISYDGQMLIHAFFPNKELTTTQMLQWVHDPFAPFRASLIGHNLRVPAAAAAGGIPSGLNLLGVGA